MQDKTLDKIILMSENPEIHSKLTNFLIEKSIDIHEIKTYENSINFLEKIESCSQKYLDLEHDRIFLDITFPEFNKILRKMEFVGIYANNRSILRSETTEPKYNPEEMINSLKKIYSNL